LPLMMTLREERHRVKEEREVLIFKMEMGA
jgi:hypothetical protein